MAFFLRRLLGLFPILLLISFLAFLLVHAAPGSPFDKDREPASPEIERNLRAKYHLDEPLLKQYLRYLSGVIRGDFGPSLKYRNHTVNDLMRQGLPVSLTIGFCAFVFALGLGVLLGFIAAAKRGGWPDHLLSLVSILMISVPAFVVGPVLIMIFAVKLKWFPVGLWEGPLHLVLPTLTLGLYFAGRIARLTREGMLGVIQSEFVTAARAKGLTEPVLLVRHGLRLAILPVVSYSGPLLTDLLTGSFVVENLFQIPGIGVFLVNSSLNRDYPMVLGVVLLYAVVLLLLNLLVDVLYTVLDPRVRLG